MTDRAPTSAGRRWPITLLGLLAFGVVGLAATQLLAVGLFSGARAIGGGVGAWATDTGNGAILLGGVAMLLGFLLPTILLSRTLLRETPATLRWRGPWRTGRAWAGALAVGAGLAAIVLALGTVVGGAAWIGDGGTVTAWGGRALELAVLFAPAALAEEVIFRGLPLVVVARHTGRAVAAVVMAVLFAMAHWGNPEASALGLVNIGIAGLWLTAAFYAPGGLWAAFGVHLGWNWALAVLDAPVSGYDLNIPLIDYFPGGPRWLTGGWFGPEGGLTGTLGLVAGTVLLLWYARRAPAPALQALTTDEEGA